MNGHPRGLEALSVFLVAKYFISALLIIQIHRYNVGDTIVPLKSRRTDTSRISVGQFTPT